MDWTTSLRALGSIFFLIGILALASDNRKRIPWALVAKGVLIQFVFAFLILRVSFVEQGFQAVGQVFVNILGYTREGSLFLFGSLISNTDSFGYIFAFQVLPTIIFFSALTSLLFYLGVIQRLVKILAKILSRFLGISGMESLSVAGNIFLGQTEAPLLIKAYLEKMNKSEMLLVMVGGMATVAGAVLAAYIGFLGGGDKALELVFAKHLLAASVMAAPGAIVISKILYPQTQKVNTDVTVSQDKIGSNILDAIANGTTEGLKLAVNVGAMLLVFVAVIAMLNGVLGFFGGFDGVEYLGWEITSLNEIIANNTLYKSLSDLYKVQICPIPSQYGRLINANYNDILVNNYTNKRKYFYTYNSPIDIDDTIYFSTDFNEIIYSYDINLKLSELEKITSFKIEKIPFLQYINNLSSYVELEK